MANKVQCQKIIFSGHAVRRLFERDLSTGEVKAVIDNGEIIASYPDDQPYPTYLILGWSRGRPLHVVLALDAVQRRCYLVTAYSPDPALCEPDFKTRRKP